MLTRKTLRLLNGAAPEGLLLRREELSLHQQALSVLEQAHEQAQALRDEAQAQAEAELAAARRQWEAQFWQQAQGLLDEWQQQREAEQAQLVTLAGNVLNEALQQILDEVDDAQRFHALLKQLLRQHPRQQQATLYCAPAQEEAISGWLAAQPPLAWTLCGDHALAADSLRLVTAQGELLIDWPTLRQQLLPALSEACA